ncbi:MAG TPA: type II toxin-antitoxin system death-on-curing family toxin [Dongiaceae bacterium]
MSFFWVHKQALLLLHDESLAEHGGLEGLRDEGLLDSALARPQNLAVYDSSAHIAALAAAYGFGLARNHPFADGNKRAAFLSVGLFLSINGWRLATTAAEATQIVLGVASGELEEVAFAAWVRDHLQPR